MDDIDKFMEETREAILDHGYTVQHTDVRSASFGNLPRAHTVGRSLFGRPEIIIVGQFQREEFSDMLGELVHLQDKGELVLDSVVEACDRRWRIDSAEPTALIGAMAAFGGGITAVQAVWAAPDGTFPGEPQMLRPPKFHPLLPDTDPYGDDA